jgi:hypothetical protein
VEVAIKVMKKVRFLLPLFLLFVVPVTGQVEHAPMPQQCRADVNAWDVPGFNISFWDEEVFSNFVTRVTHDHSLTAKELDARQAELDQCLKTDKSLLTADPNRYVQARRAYSIAALARMADYMKRHNLVAQFYDEDEQGKR